MTDRPTFTFPRRANRVVPLIGLGLLAVLVYVGVLLAYAGNPTTLNVGYAPVQPIPFSHALHAGTLGLDCRYCHSTVERTGMAALPTTETCMNCHAGIWPKSDKLAPLRQAHADGKPIPWIKVHALPDYVYFNHAAHVTAGVGCAECHGPVHQMETVRQVKTLSMAWCIDCHRDPDAALRPLDKITDMDYAAGQDASQRAAEGAELRKRYHLQTSTDCITCHR